MLRRFTLFITASLSLLWFALPVHAQNGDNVMPDFDSMSTFRPLGRFWIEGDTLMHSPDSFHVLALTSVYVEIPAEVVDSETAESETSDESSESDAATSDDGVQAETVEEEEIPPEPEYERITTMTMWDIRGGDIIWSREIEDRDWEDIAFSPSGDTLYIRSLLDQDDDDPENDVYRLTVYDPLTGDIISRSGNLSTIGEPLVPGEIQQPLTVSSRYATDVLFLTTVSRPLVGEYCNAWDVRSTTLVWSQANSCGVLSPQRTYIAALEPHTSGSAYNQITVYTFADGERLIGSPDEVVDFQWLDDHTIIIHRPYGDPPVVWEIVNNTRAVIEQPYRMSIEYPLDALTEMILRGGEVGFYVWDKSTGELLRETEIRGSLFNLDNRMVVLEINPNWASLRNTIAHSEDPEAIAEARAELEKAFLLRDFITGDEIWAHPHHHNNFRISSDGTWGYAYDGINRGVDFFDLRTGEIVGTMPTMRGNFHFTNDLKWAAQVYGNIFTVWGDESELHRFDNPPNTVTRWDNIGVYSAPSWRGALYDILPEGAYLWVYGQSSDRQWVIAQDVDGSVIWLRATGLSTPVPTHTLPSLWVE